ncbi:helix-turn-helix transcriptional regulator [Agromyces aerolatus]|uniref:helix-turn-helix transcriptional regulator n=1 Tax=Agromyces sp. LY-1074 TaxID=3074080 RepID=UPI002859183B|nr:MULTISPECIES: AAA family ATPase [unclassified Agromyces]MDR5701906.1 AAA family ATPase [Agromyces sp. LY-1074]MDR5708126.1 AAA family ATPase [Agromyces sp. LY-1358]
MTDGAPAAGSAPGTARARATAEVRVPGRRADVGGPWDHEQVTTSVSSPEMVGRQADLAWLESSLVAVREGVPRTAVLGGEAGIGKTRLLLEFTRRCGADVRVLAGQSVDLGDVAAPYAPVKAALRALVADVGPEAVLASVGPGRAALTALLPELASGEPEPAGPAAAGAAATGQLHEAIAVLLETLSRDRPIVFVVEDLHWIDAASLALLRFLMRALTAGRVLLVLTYRTEDLGRGHPVRAFLTEAERDRSVERREISRLSRAEVGRLARLLGGPPGDASAPSEAAIERVYQRSEGVPFFVEELIGIDGCRDEIGLPATLRDLLLVRYERLSESSQELLRLISTGGVRVSHALLSAVHRGSPDELDAAAREAVIAGVLTVEGDEYGFRHALVREAILADLLPGERTRFHARYAEAYELASATGTRRLAAEISFHWLGAHDAVRAFPATIQAMREARAAAAYASAAQLGERAISLWEVVPEAERVAGMGKIELMGRTASHLRNAGESERSLSLIRAALEECPDDDAQVPRLLRDQALVLSSLGRPGSAELLREALHRIEALDDPVSREFRATVLIALAGRLMIAGEFGPAVEVADEALALASEADAPRAASVAMNILSVSRAERGEVAEGLAGLEEARELARGDGSALLRYWTNASDLHYLVGQMHRAVRTAEEGLARAREQGLERSSGVILASNAVDPLFALGEWSRADQLVERALGLDPPTSFTVYLVRARIWSLVWRGELDEASDLYRSSRAAWSSVMDLEMQARLSVGRVATELALESGDLEGAWRAVAPLVDEPLLPHPGYALPYLWAAARVLAEARRETASVPELADAAGRDAEAVLRDLIARASFWPTAPLWTAFFEAELVDHADVVGRDRAWRDAHRAALAPETPVFLEPYALLRLAEAQLAAGDRTTARATLQTAFELAQTHGIGLVRARIEAVAAASALTVGDAPPPPASSANAGLELTPRERQVLALVAEGLSNKQIGERLFISGKTASVHVSAILRKLGATTRTEAAVRAGALR